MAKRKKTDIIQLKVRMTEELRKRLEVAAKNDERSLNSEIVARLARSFPSEELIWNIFQAKDLPPELKSAVHRWLHARVVALPETPSAEPHEDEFHQDELRETNEQRQARLRAAADDLLEKAERSDARSADDFEQREWDTRSVPPRSPSGQEAKRAKEQGHIRRRSEHS